MNTEQLEEMQQILNPTIPLPTEGKDLSAEEAVELALQTPEGRRVSGCKRRVHFLWGGRKFAYVRVNHHSLDTHYVVKSFFLRVEKKEEEV